MSFALALRQAMGDMSQGQLAEISGVRQATISRYLAGKRLPGIAHLDALERALPRLREIRTVSVAHAV